MARDSILGNWSESDRNLARSYIRPAPSGPPQLRVTIEAGQDAIVGYSPTGRPGKVLHVRAQHLADGANLAN